VYLFLFFVLFGRPVSRIPGLVCLGLAALLCVPYLAYSTPALNIFGAPWVTVVHMRIFSVPSLLIIQYVEFFGQHPLTYGSHISGIGALIRSPYDLDIPRTVGFHYYGTLVTSNVNFWAQDGIAGFGLLGIPVISLAASIVLWLLDSMTRHLSLRFVGSALGGILLQFLGVSLFTTLITGGLLLIMPLFWLLPERTGIRNFGINTGVANL
jgi:hypothetical protein